MLHPIDHRHQTALQRVCRRHVKKVSSIKQRSALDRMYERIDEDLEEL